MRRGGRGRGSWGPLKVPVTGLMDMLFLYTGYLAHLDVEYKPHIFIHLREATSSVTPPLILKSGPELFGCIRVDWSWINNHKRESFTLDTRKCVF